MANDVTEVEQAKAWIYSALSANVDIAAVVGTRIYADYVPEPPANRTYPYVLYEPLSGPVTKGVGRNILLKTPLFQVRLVTRGRPDAVARKVAKRIEDVLHHAANQPSGDYYFSSELADDLSRPETDSETGLKYHNLGGFYRLHIGRTP